MLRHYDGQRVLAYVIPRGGGPSPPPFKTAAVTTVPLPRESSASSSFFCTSSSSSFTSSSLSSVCDVAVSFSSFWNLYRQQPVALSMCTCVCVNVARVFTSGREYACAFMWLYTATFPSERRKKEKKRKEETEAAKGEGGGRKGGKKIREKVADSIGGNEFKMAARGSVLG